MLNRDLKKTLVAMLLIALAVNFQAKAQMDAQLTQYWAVPSYYNPGSIGNVDFIHITAGSRLQWLGVKHAPMSFMALADMPFKFLNRIKYMLMKVHLILLISFLKCFIRY